MRVVVVTGGFDPLHSGHIAYFNAAKELGDILCVGLNSDDWLVRKKARPFMPFEERKEIVSNIKCVGYTFGFDDSDGSAVDAIRHVKEYFPNNSEIIFANGGDRTKDNIPEMVFDDCTFKFGVGGDDKKNSSSWILKEWKNPVVNRAWGSYTVLDKNGTWAVKELSFDVGKSLSDQRHFKRSEHWHVVDGVIEMYLEFPEGRKQMITCPAGHSIDIPVNTWHKAVNIGKVPAKIIEVWQGSELLEEDIERRPEYK